MAHTVITASGSSATLTSTFKGYRDMSKTPTQTGYTTPSTDSFGFVFDTRDIPSGSSIAGAFIHYDNWKDGYGGSVWP